MPFGLSPRRGQPACILEFVFDRWSSIAAAVPAPCRCFAVASSIASKRFGILLQVFEPRHDFMALPTDCSLADLHWLWELARAAHPPNRHGVNLEQRRNFSLPHHADGGRFGLLDWWFSDDGVRAHAPNLNVM